MKKELYDQFLEGFIRDALIYGDQDVDGAAPSL
jgi:hypothetical protein